MGQKDGNMSEKREVLPSLEGYTFAKLTCADVSLIQAVLERCADYLDLVAGLPPSPSLALRLCTELPEGKNEQDKWLFGIFVAQHHCIGLLDAVCNYPRSGEWFLGLLLLEPAWRGHQRGEQIYRTFEQWVISSGAHAIHLSVALQNEKAFRFWIRLGFEEGERRAPEVFGAKESIFASMRRTFL